MKIYSNLHTEFYLIRQSSYKRIKFFVILIALMLGCAIKSYSKNYYVKSTGNDNNTGLSDEQAWATIAKVNASSFLPGDAIFFNKGDTWRETLIIPSSGNAGQPIVFSSYGTGNKPIIQPTTQVTSWTQVGGTDIWYGTLTDAPAQVFINDAYVQPAHWPTAVGASTPTFQYPSGNSADATHLIDADLSGIASANLVGAQVNIYTTDFTQKNVSISAFNDATDILTMATVTICPDTTMRYYLTVPAGTGISFSSKSWMITENTWFYDTDAQRLYVWKTGGGNPGTVEASTGNNAIFSNEKSYITIDDIHLRYSKAEGIFCTNYYSNVSGISVQNCTSDYNMHGIRIGKTLNANPATITNASINNNSLDHNGFRGIFTNGADNTSIVDNTINYTGGLYPQLPGGGSRTVGVDAMSIVVSDDAGEFLIDGNIISYSSQYGILFSCINGTISNNTISNTCLYLPDAGAIYSTEINSNVIVCYNNITSNAFGIYMDVKSDGGIIEHNTINGGLIGFLGNEITNTTVRYNHFVGPFTVAAVAYHAWYTNPLIGNAFYYNIIDGVDKSARGIYILEVAALENSLIDIQNNLVMNCSTGIDMNWFPSVVDDFNGNIFYNNTTHVNTGGTSVVSLDYNLYYGTGNWIWEDVPQATFALWKTASSGDVNSIYADPLFVSSSDFHLRTESPCINAGIDVGLTTDYDGNTIKDPPSIGVYDYDSTPTSPVIPVYQSSVVENAAPSLIEMTYNLALASTVPATSAFSVQVNSVARTITSVTVSGTKVLLTLGSPVAYGDVVTVAYTKPSSNPLQTTDGGQAASISAQTVTNRVAAPEVPVYSGAAIENATPSRLEMTYNLSLANIVPAASAFAVKVNSNARTVSSIAISGTKVLLTLSSPVAYGGVVTVAYTKPSSNPLQTTAGGQAASITAQTVTNRVAVINIAPVVVVNNISGTYSGFVGKINASGSYDANKDNLTYAWKVPGNIPVSATNSPVIEFLAPIVDVNQTFEFSLTVSDGKSPQTRTVPVTIIPYEPGLEKAEVISVEAASFQSPYYPYNILDGNIGTMWSVNGNDQWIILELNGTYSIQHIKLAFQPGQKKEFYFDIFGSNDKENWEPVLSKSRSCAFSGNLQVFDFPASKTEREFRYVKLVGQGNSTDNWNYIAEFRIFGRRHKNPADYEEQIVKIYPNPAHEKVNILIDEPTFMPDFIKIASLTGKVIYYDKVDPDIRQFQIPIDFKQGIYIVQMGSDGLTLFTQKLVVNN